jgi:hypothetical protein
MIPPPTTSMRCGRSSSSAPVESMMRGSSGRFGRRIDSEPAAMMQCAKETRRFAPSLVTSISCGETNLPVPRITSTLRCFARVARPPVSLPTTLFFHSRNLVASICGLPNCTPALPIASASSITFAACSNALDGMQPTLRHTPPSCGQRSINAVFMPRSAARNAAV